MTSSPSRCVAAPAPPRLSTPPPQRLLPGCIQRLPRLTVCRAGGAAIRRHQGDLGAGGRHAAADRQTFVQGAAEQVRIPPPPNIPKPFSSFLGAALQTFESRERLRLSSVDAERGAVAAQGRGPEHAHTVRPGSQHHLPVNQKRFPGEACCVFRPGGSVPAAAMQTRFHERWGGSLYVSGAVGVCGWRGGRGVGRCDEGNAHPFLCRNTAARSLSGGDTKPLTNIQAISRVSKLSSTPRWKIRCRRPPLAFFCPRSRPCRFTRPQPPKCRALFGDAK